MKDTLRIIINAYFRGRNTRCSSNAVGGKLPQRAMVGHNSTPRISVLKPIMGLDSITSLGSHSLSASSLHTPKESASDIAIGAFSIVGLLALAFIALGV